VSSQAATGDDRSTRRGHPNDAIGAAAEMLDPRRESAVALPGFIGSLDPDSASFPITSAMSRAHAPDPGVCQLDLPHRAPPDSV
jgi:hypothetical protein